MGFFGSIGKALLGVAKASVSLPYETAKAVVKPIVSLTQGKTFSQAFSKEQAIQSNKALGGALLKTAGVATLVAVPSTAIGRTAVVGVTKAVGKTIIKNPIKSLIGGALIYGAVKEQPEKTLKAVTDLPMSIANVGGNVATLIAEPSVEHAKELFTENPLLVGGATAVGALALGKGALLTASAVKTLTSGDKEVTIQTGEVVTPTTKGQTDTGNLEEPLSPVTTSVTTGQKRRRYKKAKKVVTPSIRQNVLVQVSNRAVGTTTKKYLNRAMLVRG